MTKAIQLPCGNTVLVDDEIDAAKRYNEMSIKYHGEFGKRNIIPEYVEEK